MDGQEEVRSATEPPPIQRKRSTGDETVNMRMMRERLLLGMNYVQEPDLSAEVPGIAGDGLERRRDGVEQDRINHRLVKCYLGDFTRHRENDVEIWHRQQIGLRVGKPPSRVAFWHLGLC